MFAVCLPMFVVGYIITFVGYITMQDYFPGNYAYLEIVWLFSGINVFMMTFPVFVFVQKLNVSSSPLLSKVASLTFGIYLCHFVLIQMGYDFYETVFPDSIPPVVKIVCNAFTVFVISALFVRLLFMSKITRRLVA